MRGVHRVKRPAEGIVDFGGARLGNPSALVLVFANLVPLFGVLYSGWSAFEIVWLFWFENAIIGAFNILKLLALGIVGGPTEGPAGAPRATGIGTRVAGFAGMLFLSGFFLVHYGLFNFVHGVFVLELLGKGSGFHTEAMNLRTLYVGNVDEAVRRGLGPAILTLVGSHAFSFALNFLGRREYAQANGPLMLFAPYGRVVILHVAILLGAFAALALGSPVGVLALLIAGKTALDLLFHLKERRHGGAIPIRKPRPSRRSRSG